MKFWNLFRLIFVIFFLYLIGDAFYRWDGFKYYASFLEFLPSIALVSVMWTVIAAFAALVVWLFYKVLVWICMVIRLKAGNEQLFLGAGLFVLMSATVAAVKMFILSGIQVSKIEMVMILLSVVFFSIFLTWMLRSRAKDLTESLLEGVTPLVWFFGVIVAVSLPVVVYYTLSEPPDRVAVSSDYIEKDDRPNILLITYDALTTENMSLYGYKRNTTPFISEWARSATTFEKCEAAANTTSQTVASLMTGKRVWSHRRYQSDAGKPVDIEAESLPLLLKKSGYYNMAFIANDIASVSKLGIAESFDVNPSSSEIMEPASIIGSVHKVLIKYFAPDILLYDWILKEDFILSRLLQADFIRFPSRTEFPVRKVFDMFLDEIDANHQKPFFAWIHLYPPHAPYLPPTRFMGMFDPSPKFRTAKSQFPVVHPRHYSPEQQGDVDIIRARYDEFIKYCDEEFKYLIEQLSSKEEFHNSVIILSSDHGESFERGYLTHGSHFLYEEMTRIPLIIKRPGQKEGRVIDIPVEQTDISATILDLAGIPVPPWMDGRSLEPALMGAEIQPAPVFSMNLEAVHMRGQEEVSKGVFAVWEGDYKLIYYPTTDTSMLFNLKNDPDEQNNLLYLEAEVAQRLLGLIKDSINKVTKRFDGEMIYKRIN